MVMKNDGKHRTSKASKKKSKTIKCKKCKSIIQYSVGDLIKLGGITYVECPMCGIEIVIKG